MIKLLGYKIEKINLYATFATINTNININIRSYKLFLISISGILLQLLLIPLISNQLFLELNISLIIYNLLPIYPLDGYKILLSLIEYYLPYSKIIKISYLVSLITLILFFIINKNIIVFITLYILNLKYIIEYQYYIEKFILERYLYNQKYSRKKVINNIHNLYKCRKNYIKYDNILYEEQNYLSMYYSKFIDF